MDKKALEVLILTLKRDSLSKSDYINYFVYFLTKDGDFHFATPSNVKACFTVLDLEPYSNISKYLSDNSKRRAKSKPIFIKSRKGYRLERTRRDAIEAELKTKKPSHKATSDLRQLLSKMRAQSERDFLEEAIRCFENEAPRGGIVLTWILTLDHLFEYILKNKLNDFNSALAKNTDKRIKISIVSIKDDFNDIPENKFIEFCRNVRIISNDVRKILDTKLGIRNLCANPSVITVSETKAAEFVEDLVLNVINKYVI